MTRKLLSAIALCAIIISLNQASVELHNELECGYINYTPSCYVYLMVSNYPFAYNIVYTKNISLRYKCAGYLKRNIFISATCNAAGRKNITEDLPTKIIFDRITVNAGVWLWSKTIVFACGLDMPLKTIKKIELIWQSSELNRWRIPFSLTYRRNLKQIIVNCEGYYILQFPAYIEKAYSGTDIKIGSCYFMTVNILFHIFDRLYIGPVISALKTNASSLNGIKISYASFAELSAGINSEIRFSKLSVTAQYMISVHSKLKNTCFSSIFLGIKHVLEIN